ILLFTFIWMSGFQEAIARQAPAVPSKTDTLKQTIDSTKVIYPIKDEPFLNLDKPYNGIHLRKPGTIKREVDFDPVNRQYIIRENIGNTMYRPPRYLSIDEYQQYEEESLKAQTWRELSDEFSQQARQ